MCVTDLDLELQEIAEDELAPRSDQHASAAQQPGVAWGRPIAARPAIARLTDLDVEAASAS